MFENFTEYLERAENRSKHTQLENHICFIEKGGPAAIISLLNLKLKYLFRSRDEILQELRAEKAELEKELDYIG